MWREIATERNIKDELGTGENARRLSRAADRFKHAGLEQSSCADEAANSSF
jgi:hypothetical protein